MDNFSSYINKNESIEAEIIDGYEEKGWVPTNDTENDMTQAFRSEIDAQMDMHTLKNLYASEQWVFICCNVIGRKISKQYMQIEREVFRNGKVTSVPSRNDTVINILSRPNDHENYTSFIYKVASELPLMGNAIIWKLRFSGQLILLPTEVVTIKFDSSNRVAKYCVNMGNSEDFAGIFDGTLEIHPDDIIHIKLPNLSSTMWGLSPFVPGKRSVLFDRYTTDYLLKFYTTQINPGPVLEMDDKANEKKALTFMKSMEIAHRGRRNQRKQMILPRGVKMSKYEQAIAETNIKVHLDDNRDSMRALFSIPKHEFGIQGAGSLGSDETKQALKNFWETTLMPYQDLITDALTIGFARTLGKRDFISFDNSNVIVLQDDLLTKATLADTMLSTRTLNEVRQIVWQDPPLVGGDALPGKKEETNPFGGFGQFAAPNNIEEKSLKVLTPSDKLKAFKDRNMEWWDFRYKNEVEESQKLENKVLEETLNIFSDIAVDTMKIFRNNIKSSTKGDDTDKVEGLLNKTFGKYAQIWTDKNVKTLQNSTDLGYDVALNVPFNIPNEDEREALRAENDDKRKAQMEARSLENFEGVTQTTTNDIIGIIERGTERSATLDQIGKDIQTYFSDIIPSRAKTIARTETLGANSAGQKGAMDDAIEAVPGMKKLWLTAGDGNRVRESHQALDGQEIKATDDFDNGLEYPRDPKGEAEDIINCRCSLLLIPPGEDLDSSDIDFTGLS